MNRQERDKELESRQVYRARQRELNKLMRAYDLRIRATRKKHLYSRRKWQGLVAALQLDIHAQQPALRLSLDHRAIAVDHPDPPKRVK